MPRKYWVIIVLLVLVVILTGAAGVAALILVPQYRAEKRLANARQLVAAGNYAESRSLYQNYLFKNGDDIEVLEEYIDACEKVLTNRRLVLSETGRALVRLSQLEPENEARKTKLLAFYRNHRFWSELESLATLYGGEDLKAMPAELAYDRVVAVDEQGLVEKTTTELTEYIALGRELRDTPLRLARLYRRQRDQIGGDAVFPPLLDRFPQDAMLKVYYAAYLIDDEKDQEAAAMLADAIGVDESNIDYLVTSIRLAVLQEDFEKALSLGEEAVSKYPENSEAHLNYLIALERAGKRDVAVAHINAMTPEFRVDTPGFMILLAEMRLEADDPRGADEVRKDYYAAYPDQDATNQYLSGRVALAENDLKEARKRFAIASQMNPNLYRASYFLAVTELKMRNRAGARNPLEQYLRGNPNDVQARRLWSENFDEPRSRLELRAATQRILDGSLPEMDELLYLVQDLSAVREPEYAEMARKLLEKAILLAPSESRAYNSLAGFYLEEGDTERAEATLAAATAAGINPNTFLMMKANILLVKGEVESALSTARSYLDKATPAEVQQWAVFFANQGYFVEADSLMANYAVQGAGTKETLESQAFRLSLALQFGALDDARARLAEAEATYAERAPDVPVATDTTETNSTGAAEAPASDVDANTAVINRMRLALADGLVAGSVETPVDEVEALLSRVADVDPDNDGLHIVRARIYLKAKLPDLARAKEFASKVLEGSDYYVQALQLQAEIAAIQGNYALAESLANTIIEQSGDDTQSLHLLADAQLGLQNSDGARDTLERVLNINKNDTLAMRMLVRIYEQLNRPQKADEMLQRFIHTGKHRPEHAAQVEELRAFLNRSGASETPVVESEPVSTTTATSYAKLADEVNALVAQSKFTEAIEKIKVYLATNQDEAEPRVMLGQVILAQGSNADLGEASTAFTMAQVIVPEYGPALLGQVDVQIRLNNLPNAISICERYLKNHEGNADVMFRLATLLSQDATRRAEALTWIEKAIALEARPPYLQFRAALFVDVGRYDDAIADINRIVELTGEATADDELILAESYHGKGDLTVAREHLSAARARIPASDSGLAARADELEKKFSDGGSQ